MNNSGTFPDKSTYTSIVAHPTNVPTIRAECVIPRQTSTVWGVLTDYGQLHDIIPVVHANQVRRSGSREAILRQRGRVALGPLSREFTLTLRVLETPMSHIAFEAIDGDFRYFGGTWHVEARCGGTWIAHTVSIQPSFFAPAWLIRRLGRSIMEETIDRVVRRCTSSESAAQTCGVLTSVNTSDTRLRTRPMIPQPGGSQTGMT